MTKTWLAFLCFELYHCLCVADSPKSKNLLGECAQKSRILSRGVCATQLVIIDPKYHLYLTFPYSAQRYKRHPCAVFTRTIVSILSDVVLVVNLQLQFKYGANRCIIRPRGTV